jgi:hypothetical protein
LETVRALIRRPPLDPETPTLWPKISEYRAGSLVRHPEWGLGVVQKQEGEGDSQKLTIIFRDVGRKELAAKYAKLERVSNLPDESLAAAAPKALSNKDKG